MGWTPAPRWPGVLGPTLPRSVSISTSHRIAHAGARVDGRRIASEHPPRTWGELVDRTIPGPTCCSSPRSSGRDTGLRRGGPCDRRTRHRSACERHRSASDHEELSQRRSSATLRGRRTRTLALGYGGIGSSASAGIASPDPRRQRRRTTLCGRDVRCRLSRSLRALIGGARVTAADLRGSPQTDRSLKHRDSAAGRSLNGTSSCHLYVTYELGKWSGRLDSNQRRPAPKREKTRFPAFFCTLRF